MLLSIMKRKRVIVIKFSRGTQPVTSFADVKENFFRKEKTVVRQRGPCLYYTADCLSPVKKSFQRRSTSVIGHPWETKVKCFRGETLFASPPILPCHLDVLRVFPRNNRAARC